MTTLIVIIQQLMEAEAEIHSEALGQATLDQPERGRSNNKSKDQDHEEDTHRNISNELVGAHWLWTDRGESAWD